MKLTTRDKETLTIIQIAFDQAKAKVSAAQKMLDALLEEAEDE